MPSKKQASDPAPIITFYSYKGGVGRSMAVLNVASLIASRGFRVLIIDFDLEAPGLSHLLGKAALPAKSKAPGNSKTLLIKDGIVELLSDAVARGPQSDLFAKPFSQIAEKYTFSYRPPKELEQHAGANLSIMPAGRQDENYPSRFDLLDLPGLYRAEGNPGKRLILHFRDVLRNCGLYDYILIDSRTGHSDEAGICTRDLADHRMVVSGLNTQNISGTATFLCNLNSALTREGKQLKTPDIVLSPVPNGEDETVADCEKDAREKFKNAWGNSIKLDLLIPYHPRLALSEEAYFPTITASPLRSAYLAIESRLLDSLGHTKNSLFNAFKKQVQDGQGKLALGTLHHWIKLLRTPGRRNAPQVSFAFHFLIYDEDEALKKLLGLPEGFEILKTLATVTGDGNSLLRVAREIHPVAAETAVRFDEFLLTLNFFDADDLGNYAVFLGKRGNESKAEEFYKRAIAADPKHANNLGNYALFLGKRGNESEAEEFYKRAIEAAPKHANNLGNYALFLEKRGKESEAEEFYKRAIEADPKHAHHLGNYADSLEKRGNESEAEEFYKRAIESDPKHARHLGNYAVFLEKRGNESEAEEFYKRAIAADPKHSHHLGNYAVFLEKRGNESEAEEIYKRAIEADPKHANNLGNYGQFLIGRGHAAEGLKRLRAAWEHDDRKSPGNSAEISYSLWLGTLLAGAEEKVWARIFKNYISVGFRRHQWNFDAMLARAKEKLQPNDFTYAKALAEAFLDETKVPALEKFPRWRKLAAIDPALSTGSPD